MIIYNFFSIPCCITTRIYFLIILYWLQIIALNWLTLFKCFLLNNPTCFDILINWWTSQPIIILSLIKRIISMIKHILKPFINTIWLILREINQINLGKQFALWAQWIQRLIFIFQTCLAISNTLQPFASFIYPVNCIMSVTCKYLRLSFESFDCQLLLLA